MKMKGTGEQRVDDKTSSRKTECGREVWEEGDVKMKGTGEQRAHDMTSSLRKTKCAREVWKQGDSGRN